MRGTLERQQHNDTTTGTEQTDATGNGITPEMYELLFGGADETADNGETATAHDDVMSYQVDADELDGKQDAESETQGDEGSQDADVPLSFADKHPDWEFGDGGIKDNPYTTSLIKKYYMEYYGVEPTDEQVEELVHVATNEAQYGSAEAYGNNYEAMCQNIVETDYYGGITQGEAQAVYDNAYMVTDNDGEADDSQPNYQNTNYTTNSSSDGGSAKSGDELPPLVLSKISELWMDFKRAYLEKNGELKISALDIRTYEDLKLLIKYMQKHKQEFSNDVNNNSNLDHAEALLKKIKIKIIKLILHNNANFPTSNNVDDYNNARIIFTSSRDFSDNEEIGKLKAYIGVMGGNTHGVGGYGNGTMSEVCTRINQLAKLGVKFKVLSMIGHGGGTTAMGSNGFDWAKISPNPSDENYLNLTSFQKKATILVQQCWGLPAAKALQNKIIEQYKKKYPNNWKQKLKEDDLVIWSRNHVASPNANLGEGKANKFLKDYLKNIFKGGNNKVATWYRSKFNPNTGRFYDIPVRHPAYKKLDTYLNGQNPEDMRKFCEIFIKNPNKLTEEDKIIINKSDYQNFKGQMDNFINNMTANQLIPFRNDLNR